MSASRLDTFNRCRFGFFCRYGLSVKKLQPAEFDVLQRGTVVHYCLERFVKEYGKGVSVLSPEKIEELTDGYINDYLDGVTGYRAVETARGRFLVSRISRSVKEVAKRLAEEFAQSGFEPIACELKIGGEGEKLEFPYDGGKISVSGSIDRVDKFGGYIRVVDYKTGSKKFKLPDILFGLNLQMLLYLYAAVRGAGLPDEDAAGILYMPSKRDTADKGMAGAYNQNLLKFLREHADPNDRFYVIGQVGYRALRHRDPRLVEEFRYSATAPTLQRARDITVDAIDDFKSGKLDEIYIVYTKIQNALTSEPVMERLLPLDRRYLQPAPKGLGDPKGEVELVPDAWTVFEQIAPIYMHGMIFGAMTESFCAEQSARMTAMDSATKSAKDMIHDLELEYNRSRQGSITQEITEIIGGAAAVQNQE